MKQGAYRPTMGGKSRRVSHMRIERFGKPVRPKDRFVPHELSSSPDESSYERSSDDCSLAVGTIAGFSLGGLLS